MGGFSESQCFQQDKLFTWKVHINTYISVSLKFMSNQTRLQDFHHEIAWKVVLDYLYMHAWSNIFQRDSPKHVKSFFLLWSYCREECEVVTHKMVRQNQITDGIASTTCAVVKLVENQEDWRWIVHRIPDDINDHSIEQTRSKYIYIYKSFLGMSIIPFRFKILNIVN